jgi:tungstate transport system substrate-binding protein
MKAKTTRTLLACLMFLLVACIGQAADDCKETYGTGGQLFTLATGSPGELGLLEKLAATFNEQHNTTMCWKKAGSGKSLALLKEKQVDIILVHAPAAEKQAVTDGWAIKRTLIGSNEFYIVGPKDDPAGIGKATSAADAYKRIAVAGSPFLSRGDNSGTNKKELAIWKQAGIQPQGDWYVITKDFMMATLKKADEVGGYFMTDSSTWVAGKKELANLAVLFKGDPFLINTYHGLCQPAGATPAQAVAENFIDFLGSAKGQEIIGSYGSDMYGEAMYNDAAYAAKYDH